MLSHLKQELLYWPKPNILSTRWCQKRTKNKKIMILPLHEGGINLHSSKKGSLWFQQTLLSQRFGCLLSNQGLSPWFHCLYLLFPNGWRHQLLPLTATHHCCCYCDYIWMLTATHLKFPCHPTSTHQLTSSLLQLTCCPHTLLYIFIAHTMQIYLSI